MATFTSTSGSYTTTLTVTETGTSTADNTSTVEFSLTLKKNSGTGLWNNDSCSWSININGTSYSGTFTYDFRDYTTKTLKGSTTQTITHNSDGSKSIAVSASVDMDNSSYVSVMKPSGTLTLTTIPRASDVTVSNYSITNTTGSLSATITSKANFYHKWRWKLGSGSWSAWSNKGAINNTTSTVTVANTTLLAQLPTATSGSFNIEVATYSDSGYSNHVGTKSATCTVSVNTSNIKPSVSLGNIGLNSTPISGYAVAGYSKVQSAWTTTNSSGATSVTTYFTVSTGSLATTSSSSTSGTVVSNVIPSNASNYTLTIYAYAKDSRGAVGATVSKSITVYGYQPPTATLKAYRTSSSSSTSEDGAGTYAYVTFSGAVRSSVNSQNTIQSTVCTYSGSISGTATNGGHYALADTQTVTFKLTVTDKVTSSTASVTIANASYPLDLYDNGSGSVGVGIGTVAEANVLKSSLIMKVNASSANVETKDTNHNGSCFIGWGSGHQNHGVYSYGYSPDKTSWTASGKWIAYRDGNGDITLNGNALTATTATRANNATYTDWTETNPTSTTPYWIPFGAGHSTNTTNRGLLTNDGLAYRTREGTATAVGYAILEVGNSINQGTAGNKYGSVRLRSATTDKYSDLACRSSEANNNTCWLPGAPQGVALEGTRQLWTGTKTSSASDSGTSIPKLALYKRARFYAIYKGNASMIWDADVTKIVALDKECEVNHTELSYMSWSSGSGYYQTFFKVSLTPSGNNMTLKFTEVRNFSVPYTGSTGTAQTGSGDYYIYRVDGVAGY